MKVYKDNRGSHDLEVQIERLQLRVKDLEEINKKHQKLNGELREELELYPTLKFICKLEII